MYRKHPESGSIIAEFKAQAVLKKIQDMTCPDDFVGSSPFKPSEVASVPETSPPVVGGAGNGPDAVPEALEEVEEEDDEFPEPEDDDGDNRPDEDDAGNNPTLRGRGKRARRETNRLSPASKSKTAKKPKAAKGKGTGRGQQRGPRGSINPHTGERQKMTYNKKGDGPPKNTGDKPKAGVHTRTHTSKIPVFVSLSKMIRYALFAGDTASQAKVDKLLEQLALEKDKVRDLQSKVESLEFNIKALQSKNDLLAQTVEHAQQVAKLEAQKDMFTKVQEAQQRGYDNAIQTIRLLQGGGGGRGPPPSGSGIGGFSLGDA